MRCFSTLLLPVLILAAAAAAQEPARPQAQGTTPPIFKSETRLVPVDVIVTDKKGVYIKGLEQKNFKVWEDNKEQPIRSFAFEADPALPAADQKRYMVLFFDVASMTAGDQIQARQTAAKFIDSNAGPNRLMAIVNFTGAMQIAQNFTEDIDRLKEVVAGLKTAVMGPALASAAPIGGRGFGGPSLGIDNFGARTLTLALRSLARNLTETPGRKTLVLFSAGFPLTPELMSQVTAAIDACNKANVAVYPVDVRGLSGAIRLDLRGALSPLRMRDAGIALAADPVRRIASALTLLAPQRGTAGTGTNSGSTTGGSAPAGGTTGGGTGAGAGGASPAGSRTTGMGGGVTSGRTGGDSVGAGSMPGGPGGNNSGFGNTGGRGTAGGGGDPMDRFGDRAPRDPFAERRGMIIPTIPESTSTNQQVLYMLAEGTGGFVIANTNDLLSGLEKIKQEQNQYYLLAYAPPESPEGSCHSIRVKVDRGGTVVRARTGYCNVKSKDVLAGKPVERQLETRINGPAGGSVPVQPMQLPFFFTSPNTARVTVAMDIPVTTLKFEKVKGKLHAEINILGIAYRGETNVAARFSDVVKLDFEEKKEVEAFQKKALRYENQFDIASGEYTLKVAFNAGGEAFGKLESPLNIDAYDAQKFSISGIALSKDYKRVNELDASMDTVLLEGRTPLTAAGLQISPSGGTQFKKTDPVVLYFELYEPALAEATPEKPVRLAVQLRILDSKSGEPKLDSGGIEVTNFARPGNPVVAVGLKLPFANLPAGSYKVEIMGVNPAQNRAVRTAEFEVL